MARGIHERVGIGRGLSWAAACAAGAVGAAVAWHAVPAPPAVPVELVETAPTAAHDLATQAAAAPLPASMPFRTAPIRGLTHAPEPAGEASAAADPASPRSKWAQVNALVASGKPADAFAAYRILSLCAVVQALQQADGRSGGDAQREDRGKLDDSCGDLSPGQLSERVRLLELAADAHVPGAVAALMNQGPEGQPVADVWDDPAFADWRRRTLARVESEADGGDPIALQIMVGQHDHGQRPLSPEDSAAALKYYTAYADVQLATNPAYASPTRRESLNMLVQRLSSLYGTGLTPEQFAAAVDAGHALVAPVVAAAPPLEAASAP